MDLIRKLTRNKKAVVFTILSIVIAVFFTVVFSARIEKPLDHNTVVVESRINVLRGYMDNFFDYALDMGSITGYAALNGVVYDINSTCCYKPNFEIELERCLKTGNISVSPPKKCYGMENMTLTYYLDGIRTIALDELNIISSYSINSVNVTQTIDAFSVEMLVNITLDIRDNYANMSDTRVITSVVPIEGMLDPLYILNPLNVNYYNQTIKKTNLKKREGDWTWQDLTQLYYNNEYRNFKNATSFINRIKGNFSQNIFGIESFVNHSRPAVQADMIDNHSLVDYLFLTNTTNLSCMREVVRILNYTIINSSTLANPYQLDEYHRQSFNISSIDVEFTCIP